MSLCFLKEVPITGHRCHAHRCAWCWAKSRSWAAVASKKHLGSLSQIVSHLLMYLFLCSCTPTWGTKTYLTQDAPSSLSKPHRTLRRLKAWKLLEGMNHARSRLGTVGPTDAPDCIKWLKLFVFGKRSIFWISPCCWSTKASLSHESTTALSCQKWSNSVSRARSWKESIEPGSHRKRSSSQT